MIKLTNDTLENKFGDTDYSSLSLHQRIVLNNGGCLTKLLEDLFEEELQLKKLQEDTHVNEVADQLLQISAGQNVLNRAILLSGVDSGVNHLYAESSIILDNLDVEFAQLLLNSTIPIGKLWEKLRVETYKTLIAWGDEKAGFNAAHFNISPNESLLYRTYLVYSKSKPVMKITEKFPASCSFQPIVKRKTA
ncbi:MAG: chorismate pyruvate-lyase family protein [Cyclobacteriaceae bacterium]